MRRLLQNIACIICALSVTCSMVTFALAAPADSNAGVAGGEMGIGALSDRFESLNNLGNILTDADRVVVETRVGVLTSANQALDMSEVRFTAEMVGDVVNASEAGYKWANAMGASNSVISVYMPDDLAARIAHTGDYHQKGTSLQITGEYHFACPEHQGELDVHATSVVVTSEGSAIPHPLHVDRLAAGAALVALAAVLVSVYLILNRTRKKRADDSIR